MPMLAQEAGLMSFGTSILEGRAKALYAKLDPHLNGDSAEAIVRNAMEGGATTANDFAQAFENAGMKKDLSISAGKVIETHLNVAAAERVTAEKPID